MHYFSNLFCYWYVCFTCWALTNLTFRGPRIIIYSYSKSQQNALFLKFILLLVCLFYLLGIDEFDIQMTAHHDIFL